MFYSVIINRNCNFNCLYCYQTDKKISSIKEKSIEQICNFIVDTAFKLCDYRICINISGGECLLFPEKVKFFISSIRKHTKNNKLPDPIIEISTNGSLLTEELMSFIKSNECSLYIGFDGLEKVQNINRIPLGDDITYQTYLNNLELLKSFNFKKNTITLNFVITSNNVGYVSENFSFLQKNFPEFRLSFNIAYNSIWDLYAIKKLKVELNKLADLYLKCIKKNKDFSINLFDRQINMILNALKGCSIPRCSAGETSFGFTPEGDIIACGTCLGMKIEKQFIIGNIEEGINEVQKNYFLKQVDIAQKKSVCSKCAHEKKCYKYCPTVNYLASGKLDEISTSLCDINKILIDVSESLLNRLCKIDTTVVMSKYLRI